MFVNLFAGLGSVMGIVGIGLLGGAVLVDGEARGGLLISGATLVVMGLSFYGAGKRVGKISGGLLGGSDLLTEGAAGRGTITRMWETGVTVNEQPVFGFEMEVTPEAGSAYTASLQQLVPRMLAGAVLPGHSVAVRINREDASDLVIDWSEMPRPGGGHGIPPAGSAAPAAALAAMAAKGLPASGEHGSIAELLAKGRRGTARLTSVTDVGQIGDLDLAEPGTEEYDDRLYAIEMMVKLPGRSEFPARVAHRVPDRLIGRVGPGIEVVVAADRDDPERSIAIDWDATGL